MVHPEGTDCYITVSKFEGSATFISLHGLLRAPSASKWGGILITENLLSSIKAEPEEQQNERKQT